MRLLSRAIHSFLHASSAVGRRLQVDAQGMAARSIESHKIQSRQGVGGDTMDTRVIGRVPHAGRWAFCLFAMFFFSRVRLALSKIHGVEVTQSPMEV